MSASLHARDLRVTRGLAVILDEISLTLAPGHRVGIIGPNGVGKSTLLHSLAGDVRLERGSVTTMPPTAAIDRLHRTPNRGRRGDG
jgi:ATPase subunit of ABC transporter with duplicated ATPase domains